MNIPPPFEPVLDARTGIMSEVWYRYLSRLGDEANRTKARYLFRTFTYSEESAKVGTIPAGATPLETYVVVRSSFIGANIRVGTTSDSSAAVSTVDAAAGTTGLYVVDRYMGTRSTAGVDLYATVATTGTTAGVADIWQAYLPST